MGDTIFVKEFLYNVLLKESPKHNSVTMNLIEFVSFMLLLNFVLNKKATVG